MGKMDGQNEQSAKVCPRCRGAKQITYYERLPHSQLEVPAQTDTCPVCKGTGTA